MVEIETESRQNDQRMSARSPAPGMVVEQVPRDSGSLPNPVQRALSTPRSLTTRDLLQLQRCVGNRATGAVVAGRKGSSATKADPYDLQRCAADESDTSASGSPAPGQVTEAAGKQIAGEDEPMDLPDAAEKGGSGRGGPFVADGSSGRDRARSVQRDTAVPIEHPALGAHGSGGLRLQRQPAPPPPAPPAPPVVVPAGRAALNFLPIPQDQTPSGWGVTTQDRAVLDITAYADGAVWKCKITTADQQTHQGIRLLPGVVEVTPALVAAEASCPTLQTMITSLNTVASQGNDSGFYMIAAVSAHENLHVTQWRTGVATHFATFRTAVEALTVPLAGSADAAAAKTAIKALPAFTAAKATYQAGETTVGAATASHSPIAPFNTVEHAVVDPMIATIRARKTTLKCPP